MAQGRDNSGILFRNTHGKSDKSPSHVGSLTIGGVEYDLAAWVKDGQKGKFFSLKVTPKSERQNRAQQAAESCAGTSNPF